MQKQQKLPYLLGSKWTAREKILGWRHFQVANRKNDKQWVFAEMVASCDLKVRFWINARQLKNENLWLAGWKTLEEMDRLHEELDWIISE